jgi:hypothetical protein
MNGKLFEKGNPGKPKGAENKTTKEARQLFLNIMEGEVDHIKNALEEIRDKDKAKYLELLSKFFPYFIPKKLDISTPGDGLKINITRKVIG